MDNLKRGWKFGAFYGVIVFVIWSLLDRLHHGSWNFHENITGGWGAALGAYMTAHELLKKKEP